MRFRPSDYSTNQSPEAHVARGLALLCVADNQILDAIQELKAVLPKEWRLKAHAIHRQIDDLTATVRAIEAELIRK